MPYELVIFDLGGVAVEAEADRLVFQVSQVLGRSFEDVQQAVYDKEMLLPFELGQISAAAYYEGLKRTLKLPWGYEQFVHAWNDILGERPKMGALLRRLRARYKLSALSNTNELHIGHVKSFKSLAPFQDWVASCDVGMRKPDAEIYRLVVQRAGVTPETAVFIDDRQEFVEAAKRAGLASFRFESEEQVVVSLRGLGIEA